MSHPNNTQPEEDNSDIIAASAIIIIGILAVIHFVQTGGLPAFFSRLL